MKKALLLLFLPFFAFLVQCSEKDDDHGKAVLSDETSFNPLAIRRAAYVQAVWGDSATIRWVSSRITQRSYVKYGTSPDSLTQHAEAKILKHLNGRMNEAVLHDLAPQQKYYYAYYTNDSLFHEENLENQYFISNTAHPNAAFSFFAMGDIGEPFEKGGFPEFTAERIVFEEPDINFGLGLGDIVYPHGGSEDADKNLFAPMKSLLERAPMYCILGNHDWETDPEQNFKKEWVLPQNRNYYHFTYGNTLFIGLDSKFGFFHEFQQQKDWLEATLKQFQGKYDWTVVMVHHNGYSCTYKATYLRVVELYPILAAYDVDLLLNGHAHTYERLHPFNEKGEPIKSYMPNIKQYPHIKNGFIPITLGAGGKLERTYVPRPENCGRPIVAHARHRGHYGIFRIEGKNLHFSAHESLTGRKFDEFVMRK